MDQYDDLIAEITRVIDSPYPTHLKHLHNLASSEHASHSIKHWAANRPCQVKPLAAAILDSGYDRTQDMIACFSPDRSVRDAFLHHQPSLLFELTAETSHAAISLLGSPLPSHIPLPKSIGELFLNVIEEAVCQPTEKDIKFIFNMFMDERCLSLFTAEAMTKLEAQLIEIVSKAGSIQGGRCILYALAAMGRLIWRQDNCSSGDAARISATFDPDNMRTFFTGRKAMKTMKLLALKALSCRCTDDDETLFLVNYLAGLISPSIRYQWAEENSAVVHKLQAGSQHKPYLIPFMLSYVEAGHHPKLCSNVKFTTAHDLARLWKIASFEQKAVLVSNMSLSVIYEPLLRTNIKDVSMIAADVVEIVDRVRFAMLRGQMSRNVAPTQLGTVTTWLQNLIDNAVTLWPRMCSCVATSSSRSIVHALSGLMIMSNDKDDTELLNNIIQLHSESAPSNKECERFSDTFRPTRWIRQQHQSHETSFSDWRTGIQAVLQQRNAHDYDNIAKVFSRACHELEERCDDVEAPLREQKQEQDKLQNKFDELYKLYVACEEARKQSVVLVDQKDVELTAMREELEKCRHQNDLITLQLTGAQDDLAQNLDKSSKAMEVMKSQHDLIMLEHNTSVARRQEEIEKLEGRLTSAMEEVHQLKSHIHEVEDTKVIQQRTISETTEQMIQTTRQLQEAQDQYNKLAGSERDTKEELETTLKNLEDLRHEHLHNVERLEKLKEISQHEVEDLTNRLNRMSDEMAEQRSLHDHITQENEDLRLDCARKDQELQRLKRMQSNMMSAMGMGDITKGQTIIETQEKEQKDLADPEHMSATMVNDSGRPSLSSRMKHRKSLSLASTVRPTQPAQSRITREVPIQSTTRQPLMAVTPNLSPRRNHQIVIGTKNTFEAEFDNDLLESTQEL